MYYWVIVDYYCKIYSRGGYKSFSEAEVAMYDFIEEKEIVPTNYVVRKC